MVAVLFWPIRTGRYLLPVIPLLGIYAIAGALAIGEAVSRLRPRWRLRPWVSGLVAAGIVGFALLEGLYAGREALQNRSALALGGGAAGYYAGRPEWGRYLEAAGWLRENAGEGDVALGRRHFLLYVMSGRYADKYRFETTPEELDYLFSGTRRKLVVEDAFSELRGDFAPLHSAVRGRGGDLRLRYETGAPAVRVWELVRAGETPGAAPSPRARPRLGGSLVRASLLVFAFLCCLYALTGGGQGYSVDGLFGYQVARSVATDPQQEFLNRNRGTLARWGPVVPALGVPFTWAGARLAQIVPSRESVPLDGSVARLHDWPALGAAGDEGARTELRLPLSPPRAVDDLRLVSFLSLATALEQGAPVAEVLVVGEGGVLGRGVLRAGVESAEWSLDVAPGGGRGTGRRPWRGTGRAIRRPTCTWGGCRWRPLAARRAPGRAGGLGREVVFRYLAPAGRLHLRAVLTAPAA